MTDEKLMARLHGGPGDGQRLPVFPQEDWVSPWPPMICLNLKQGMPMHYKLIASGVYEFAGACAEFDHEGDAVERCPDCGAPILPGSHAHGKRDA